MLPSPFAMTPDQTGLALFVLFGTATLKVYGCVCYVGQEPVGANGTGYGWSLAEQRPCECSELRLGGVNMKPQIKPHEVKIGEDNRVSVDEQGQIVQSPDCIENGRFQGTSVCPNNTFLVNSGIMELQLPMTSPIRLEVTFVTDFYALVHFSPDGPGYKEALYRVDLYTTLVHISKRESSSQSWKTAQYKRGVYNGVPVMITYDNGRFEVAVQGVQDSNITYDITSPPQPSWFVSFSTEASVELSFTDPCINDFNPQITPY